MIINFKFFSHIFCLKLPWAKESSVSTNMTNGNGPIYTQTLIFSCQHSDTSIKTQHNSASDASVDAHDL